MRNRLSTWTRRTDHLQALLLPAGVVALLLGMVGGLARIGVVAEHAPVPTVAWHGPLILFGFFGVLVSVERAVALRRPWALAAPLLGVAGTIGLTAGAPLVVVATSWALAAIVACGATLALWGRRPSLANQCMVASCMTWTVGVVSWGAGARLDALLPWWASFLVLMVVGERVQFGKLAYLARTRTLLYVLGSTLLTGCVAAFAWPRLGTSLAGIAMVGLGSWLIVVDVTRRVRRPGLLWFVSVGLAAAYAWLVVSGAIWVVAAATGDGAYSDATIHAVFQGFVMGMVFTHAPMIFPAVIGRRMPFHRIFHAHLVLLHVGLGMRVSGDLAGYVQLAHVGSKVTALAMTMFVAVSATSIIVGRFRSPVDPGGRRPATERRPGRARPQAADRQPQVR